MDNLEFGWIFEEIADLAVLAGEDPILVRDFRLAQVKADTLTRDIKDLDTDELEAEFPSEVVAVIQELKERKSSRLLNRLEKKTPIGLRQILQLPGIDVKTAELLFKNLGITSLEELEVAVKGKKIRKVRALGTKLELNIKRAMQRQQAGDRGLNLGQMRNLLGEIIYLFKRLKIEAYGVGETRRGVDYSEKLEMVVVSEPKPELINLLGKYPRFTKPLMEGEANSWVVTHILGPEIQLWFTDKDNLTLEVFQRTGSDGHLLAMGELLKAKGGAMLPELAKDGFTEADIYEALGLPYIPPELRESVRELKEIQENGLPNLIEVSDIKGDLHVHSNWSDGMGSLQELADKGKELGYEYLAVTDHSQSLKIAGGLSEKRLQEQGKEIEEINQQYEDFRLLKGIEVDILAQGKLDFSDEILQELDIVVASIHTGFGSGTDLTERICEALKNPNIDILAHPTGRLISRRDPYKVDLERVMEVAKKNQIALEINSAPDRLDLRDKDCQKAKENEMVIAINTDAHHLSRLEDIDLGVITARRGSLEKENILNAKDYKTLAKWLQR